MKHHGSNLITYQPYGKKDLYYVHSPKTLNDSVISLKKIKLNRFHKALIIQDTNIPKSFVKKIISLLQNEGLEIKLFKFDYGPKSIENVTQLWKQMVLFVPDITVGIGGGTVSDLVGFASSTYQRGIPHLIFPTTVLGMVDASIGGKTAVDVAGVKNSIGSMHYPLLVVNIPGVLKTLDESEFFSGFAEAVKAAVLFDSSYFSKLENFTEVDNFSHTNPLLKKVIQRSAELKMLNAEDKPKHKIKLLYGHAVGHALELAGKKKIRHGDAVAIGMTIEGAIACHLGIWQKHELDRQTALLRKFNLPTSMQNTVRLELLVEKMKLYKKLATSDTLEFIFPKKIGQVASNRKGFLTSISQERVIKILKKGLELLVE